MNLFGEMLYRPGIDCLEKFPSPKSLKKRVLISTKPPEKFQNSKPSQNKEHPKTDQQGQVDDDEFIEEVAEEKAALEYRNLIAIYARKLKGRLDNIFQDIVRNKARRLSMREQQLKNAVTKNHGIVIVRCLELKVEDDDGGRRLQLTIEAKALAFKNVPTREEVTIFRYSSKCCSGGIILNVIILVMLRLQDVM
ncbi:hypothetical protein Ddye_021454 [Dipteronia dyeriana]|uniref:Uncharacterized protein n=1 Tax=Dipteronia dyeriana TaxID=168575 RepID=A0AAD9WWA9_9ROSI|nr:hypothetical protein Ddye_021454 [Dipteronia dyeriana]